MSVDGGRIAARGFQYQYLRTLEALLVALSSSSPAIACRIEGPGEATSAHSVDSVDFDLADADGNSLVAVQVKSAASGRTVSAPRALEVLLHLVSGFSSQRYELVTNAVPDKGCARLADILQTLRGDLVRLRSELKEIFAKAPVSLRRLEALTEGQWERLATARILFDARDDAGLREDLNEQLRKLRRQNHRGLADRSGGLALGFLVAEVLRRAADPASASWALEDFRECVLVDDEVLVAALGRQDFGVVVGPVPPVPDVTRSRLLEQVTAALNGASPRPGVPVCVVSGLSGIGKSSLAASYVAAEAYRYDLVFWLDASTTEALTGSFARLLAHLGGGYGEQTADPVLVREQVHALLQQLAGSWLLVFDDASPGQVQAWFPRLGRGQVLVTSLSRSWRGVNGRVEVKALSMEDALQLLMLRLELDAEHMVRHRSAMVELVEVLGRWPLAIELAAGYMVTCEIDPARIGEYRSRLLSSALDDDRVLPGEYPKTLVAAVSLSLERLRVGARDRPEVLGGCAGLLSALCYFASQRIPLHLAFASAFVPGEALHHSGSVLLVEEASSPLREILRELFSVSFVRPDTPLPASQDHDPVPGSDDTVSMNTVLQLILRRLFERQEDSGSLLRQAASHTNGWLSHAIDHGQSDRAWELAQHAMVLAGHLERLEVVTSSTALLLGNLAAFHKDQGRYDQARSLLEQELVWLAASPEQDTRITAQARIRLASLLQLTSTTDPSDEITRHLSHVFDYLTALPSERQEGAVRLVTESVLILQTHARHAPGHLELAHLLEQFQFLAAQLPQNPQIRAMYQTAAVGQLMEEGQAHEAEQAAVAVLDLITESSSIPSAEVRRLLIEALAHQQNWEQADAEYSLFRRYLGPRTLYRFSVNHLVHNLGQVCAMQWVLTGNDEPLALLDRLIDDTGPYLDQLADSDYEHARFKLLRVVHLGARITLATDSTGPDEFPTHLLQLAAVPFADKPEQAAIWELILNGLPSRIGARFREVLHDRAHAHGLAALAALPPDETAVLEAALQDANMFAHLALSTDPGFTALGFASNVDLLTHRIPAFSGPRAIVIIQPDTYILVRSPDDDVIDAQVHRLCAHGLRRMWGEGSVFPVVEDLCLRPDGSTLVLQASDGPVLARVPAVPTPAWRAAAQQRGTVLVLFSYGFGLESPGSVQEILSSPAATIARYQMACQNGTLASALVPWAGPKIPVPRSRRQQRRSTGKRKR
ncbi:NB-ARC domain-containing protein [Kitasatospora sp. NPDC094011]|uniref:NB-ARC domain-containing protein n=1 Tax=Kitasatospora sp. NPDC094011 TaxID=3364090 RepID=UPI00380C0CC4